MGPLGSTSGQGNGYYRIAMVLAGVAFNLVAAMFGMMAFCCLSRDMICHPCLKKRRHAKQQAYFIAKHGGRAHASEKGPTLVGSFDYELSDESWL